MLLRVLDEKTIRELLAPSDCIEIMADAMRAVSEKRVVSMPRVNAPLFDESGSFILMPASSSSPAVYGAKLLSWHRHNPSAGRPLIQGVIVLFEHDTGTPIAILNGVAITALRTAAVSGLASKLLARKGAGTHGIFGAGVQAAAHVDSIHAAVSSVQTILVWGRSKQKAEAFAAEQSRRTGLAISACSDPEKVAACDIVSTVTASAHPILHGAWLSPGAHVNLVGSHLPDEREADTEAMVRATVYVDEIDNAMREAGDLLIPISEGAMPVEDIAGEIGQLVVGTVRGRESQKQITLFKSLGHPAQDLFAAHAVYTRAVAQARGTSITI